MPYKGVKPGQGLLVLAWINCPHCVGQLSNGETDPEQGILSVGIFQQVEFCQQMLHLINSGLDSFILQDHTANRSSQHLDALLVGSR